MKNYFRKTLTILISVIVGVVLLANTALAHSWPNCKTYDEEYFDGSIGTWVYIDYVGNRSRWYWTGSQWAMSVYHDEWDWHQTGPGYYDGYYQYAHGWYTQPC